MHWTDARKSGLLGRVAVAQLAIRCLISAEQRNWCVCVVVDARRMGLLHSGPRFYPSFSRAFSTHRCAAAGCVGRVDLGDREKGNQPAHELPSAEPYVCMGPTHQRGNVASFSVAASARGKKQPISRASGFAPPTPPNAGDLPTNRGQLRWRRPRRGGCACSLAGAPSRRLYPRQSRGPREVALRSSRSTHCRCGMGVLDC